MSGTIKTVLEELKDLKRLRNNEIQRLKEANEYLSMFKPMSQRDKLFSWLLPLVMFLGFLFGTIYLYKAMFIPCI